MQDRDWDDLRYFLSVGRQGSLSAASKQLNVNHSTVLRRLASLEHKLGVRLFERHPSGYVMTPAGEELRARLANVSDQIESAQRQLSGRDIALSGTIRITTTDTLALGLLTPYFAKFRQAHPGIQLQLILSNTFFSLTKREADVAIRPSNTPPENLIGRKVGRIQTAVYGASAYLNRNRKKSDLAEHDWVGFDESLNHLAQAKWLKHNVAEERIVFRVDSLLGMTDAVAHGLGLGLLLTMLADRERGLKRLADAIAELDTQLWVLTHPDLRHVPRIKAFTDFLYEQLVQSEHVIVNEPVRRMAGNRVSG
ncbi:MAG: LysR family transcriptional regulator [Burkholderiaceae bacterium]|nr:LysR family transcriptional regulator [Burkholderiaceae bacterium]